MEIMFKTKYKTFLMTQYVVWSPNERKYITVYKQDDSKSKPIKKVISTKAWSLIWSRL